MKTTTATENPWVPLTEYARETRQKLGTARVAAWRSLEQREGLSADGCWLFERVFPHERRSTIRCRRTDTD